MLSRPIVLATRGSALALAQANTVLAQCRAAFPDHTFEIRIIKTTGDKLQTASLASSNLPKGLFTKELEAALLKGEADIAVHSLKDLPTEMPEGLALGATLEREDPRDVLITRNPLTALSDLPQSAVVATSSTRRQAFLIELRSDLRVIPVRGNVPTRLQRFTEHPDTYALVLASAGLRRLGYRFEGDGRLQGEGVPDGLWARHLSPEEMLPCVGQAAIGLQVRLNDKTIAPLSQRLNHLPTFQCVLAERALLRCLGGGCQVPVAALAEVHGVQLRLRAVSFLKGPVRRAESTGALDAPEALGQTVAAHLADSQ